MKPVTLSGLYLIAGSGLPVETAVHWLLPGVTLVQYRNKHADKTTRRRETATLSALCRERGVGFIINDDVELAAHARANGVHLGKDDTGLVQARRALGKNVVIGVSCYDSPERALKAQRDGADYVSFGSLFDSRTKPKAAKIALRDFADYKRRLALPACAIGGITRHNLDGVLAAGADMVAVSHDVASATDPAVAVRDYLDRLLRR